MRYLIFLLFSLIFFLTVISCETTSQKEERLAKQYCGSCHLFPEPNLLDKETWANKVLPQMAFRMGFINSEIINKMPPNDLPIVLEIIPKEPIRIFENDGKNNFHQSWSYRIHGASQAEAVDFDKDGDLDIAAIAFFPDLKKHPQESFIYFET